MYLECKSTQVPEYLQCDRAYINNRREIIVMKDYETAMPRDIRWIYVVDVPENKLFMTNNTSYIRGKFDFQYRLIYAMLFSLKKWKMVNLEEIGKKIVLGEYEGEDYTFRKTGQAEKQITGVLTLGGVFIPATIYVATR